MNITTFEEYEIESKRAISLFHQEKSARYLFYDEKRDGASDERLDSLFEQWEKLSDDLVIVLKSLHEFEGSSSLPLGHWSKVHRPDVQAERFIDYLLVDGVLYTAQDYDDL